VVAPSSDGIASPIRIGIFLNSQKLATDNTDKKDQKDQ